MAYMNQERKQKLVQLAKPILRRYGMKATFSVQHHSGIVCKLIEGELKIWDDLVQERYTLLGIVEKQDRDTWYKNRPDINVYWAHEHFTGATGMFLRELINALNNGNHDRSDIMTDYHDVGWYVYINVGGSKPYVCTKPNSDKWDKGIQEHPETGEIAKPGYRWVRSLNPGGDWRTPVYVQEQIGTPFTASVQSETYWCS